MRYFGRDCIRDLTIPFWNPLVGCGMPFFAGLQGCVFYPPSILIYIFPYEIGLKAYIIFHFILSCIGSYFLGRQLKLNNEASFILSITWTFSGWLLSSIDIPIILAGSSWISCVFLFFLRSSYVLTGMCLSFQILSGEPSIFYITSIFLFIFSIFTRKIKGASISILIGIAFSLFQILPFLEFLFHSTRLSQGYGESVKWAFSPYEVFRFIIPSSCGAIVRGQEKPIIWFGQMWLKSPYLGIIPFLLAIIALIYPRKEKFLLFFSISSLIFLIISFGDHSPLYKLLYPIFSLMRYPVKFLCFATFSLSIVASFGAHYILEKRKNPINVLLVLSFIFIIFILLSIIFFPFPTQTLLTETQLVKWKDMLYKDSLFILSIVSFSIIFLFLYISDIIKRKIFIIAFICLIIIDLFFFGRYLNPLVRSSVYKKSDTIRFLEKKEGFFRICLSPRTSEYFTVIRGDTLEEAIENVKRFVIPNTSMCFGIHEAGAYDSLYLSSYFSLKEEMKKRPFFEILKLLSMMNIRFIISKDKIREEGIKLVYQDRDMFLYENPYFLERIFFVPNYRVLKKEKILEYLVSPNFNPKKEVVLEEEPKFKPKGKEIKGNARIIKYEPNRVIIEASSNQGGFLFFSDTYYPGWKAFVSKKEKKVYKANYCFRAIYIDKGKHIIEFRYFPKTFIIGAIGSIASLILIIILKKDSLI